MNTKLTLSRETLRALDDQDLTQVVGGSHSNQSRKGNSGWGSSKGKGSLKGSGKKKGCRHH